MAFKVTVFSTYDEVMIPESLERFKCLVLEDLNYAEKCQFI
jgi:hypothetical protein